MYTCNSASPDSVYSLIGFAPLLFINQHASLFFYLPLADKFFNRNQIIPSVENRINLLYYLCCACLFFDNWNQYLKRALLAPSAQKTCATRQNKCLHMRSLVSMPSQSGNSRMTLSPRTKKALVPADSFELSAVSVQGTIMI
jgi:hypothetical protein